MDEFLNYLTTKGLKLDEKAKKRVHKYLVGSKYDKISKDSVDTFIENFSFMDKLVTSQRVSLSNFWKKTKNCDF